MTQFQEGRCYFLVGYLDRQFKRPFIHSYVFIGTENAGEPAGTLWLFQDVHSFVEFGEQKRSDEAKGIDVLALEKDALDTMLDGPALAHEIEEMNL